eukprot:293482_1
MTPFFYTLIFCLYVQYSVPNALEVIANPSASTVICGTNDNCTVICNATESCAYKTFHFYITILGAKIFTSNVQSFTASMTGPKSFIFGTLYTSNTDIDIHV